MLWVINATLQGMTEKNVHFVLFDTRLPADAFVKRWEQFSHSTDIDKGVTLQQAQTTTGYKYIAQHKVATGELKFNFSHRAKKSSVIQVPINTQLIGGYALAHGADSRPAEVHKLYVFVEKKCPDIEDMARLQTAHSLNLYEAYYENCKYAFILEFAVTEKNAPSLQAELRDAGFETEGDYYPCPRKSSKRIARDEVTFEWPAL